MKIITWNVNGLNSRIQNGFWEFVSKHGPDILCLQETKADQSQVPLQMDLITRGYELFWNGGEKRKNGVAILVKSGKYKVLRNNYEIEKIFSGRVNALEFNDLILVNVYSPLSGIGFDLLEERIEWEQEFRKLIKKLQKEKPVIICGDLNVAHRSYQQGMKTSLRSQPGFSNEEWESFQKLLELGFEDVFELYGMDLSGENLEHGHTHSWRLDYILLDKRLDYKVLRTFAVLESFGSDHLALGIEIEKGEV